MAYASSIEWTGATWNPVTGCSKVSPGCKHCYAERMAQRLKAMGKQRYLKGFKLTLHTDRLAKPLHWIKPQVIFVNSMSDLFHTDVPLWFIKQVFEVMIEARWHIFQILTKRAERLDKISGKLYWPENVWIGVSIENQDCAYRIEHLQKVPSVIRFLSFEPLLGPISNFSLKGIHWVIVGGESGPKARPLSVEWVRYIRDHCLQERVSFFFKQWGGVHKARNGRILDGRTWDKMPLPLNIATV